jgi:transcriptional regulator with XRE-family HTH domain
MAGEVTALIRFPLGGTMGERVQVARTLGGRTAKDTARALGVSLKTYQRIEQNQRDLRLPELHLLAEYTGQSEEFFLGASAVDDVESPTLPLLPGAVKNGNDEEPAA